MSIEFLSSVPETDPGSEGGIGFDYQWQITSRLCIEMLLNVESIRVVCEYGEDITLHKKDSVLEKIQVKKRESGSWTFPELIKPAKKQKKGILAKLFEPLQDGKNVGSIKILGCGKVGTGKNSDCSLAEFVALLNIPKEERNADWNKALLTFISYLSENLISQGVKQETVEQAINLLSINFSLPNPESIEAKNKELLAKVIKKVLQVDASHDQIDKIYSAIFSAAKRANTSARKSWLEKSITRQDVILLVLQNLEYPYPTADQTHSLTLQDKLSGANIGDKHKYALTARTEAIGLRYEKEFASNVWEKFGVDIHLKWQDYQKENPSKSGLALWNDLLGILEATGNDWSKEHKDPRLGARFAEGVFFDMAGICTVDFKRGSNE